MMMKKRKIREKFDLFEGVFSKTKKKSLSQFYHCYKMQDKHT